MVTMILGPVLSRTAPCFSSPYPSILVQGGRLFSFSEGTLLPNPSWCALLRDAPDFPCFTPYGSFSSACSFAVDMSWAAFFQCTDLLTECSDHSFTIICPRTSDESDRATDFWARWKVTLLMLNFLHAVLFVDRPYADKEQYVWRRKTPREQPLSVLRGPKR
uniref:Uncharacterized protein n=1 Tax=Fagus sylvatica TaxID=28930 RepID=A0A2N9IB81_FAGSY